MSTNQLDKKSEAWSALFSEPMSELVKRYTASVGFDQRLWRADIEGSLAHAEMLHAQGVIGAQDWADIQRGLAQIPAHDFGSVTSASLTLAPVAAGSAGTLPPTSKNV